MFRELFASVPQKWKPNFFIIIIIMTLEEFYNIFQNINNIFSKVYLFLRGMFSFVFWICIWISLILVFRKFFIYNQKCFLTSKRLRTTDPFLIDAAFRDHSLKTALINLPYDFLLSPRQTLITRNMIRRVRCKTLNTLYAICIYQSSDW